MTSRLIAACLAAIQWLGIIDTAACAPAQAAAPFPEVVFEPAAKTGHLAAHLTLVAGAGLIGASFVWRDHANRDYGAYLTETEPARIDVFYDRTVHEDRLSSASLLAGELLFAGGLYLRFLRRPDPSRLVVSLRPQRCALALRF